MDYRDKYLKYKNKYLVLKNQLGSAKAKSLRFNPLPIGISRHKFRKILLLCILFDFYFEVNQLEDKSLDEKNRIFKKYSLEIIENFRFDNSGDVATTLMEIIYYSKDPRRMYPHFSAKNTVESSNKNYHYSKEPRFNTQSSADKINILEEINKMVELEKYVFLKIFQLMESTMQTRYLCKKACSFLFLIIYKTELNFLYSYFEDFFGSYNLDQIRHILSKLEEYNSIRGNDRKKKNDELNKQIRETHDIPLGFDYNNFLDGIRPFFIQAEKSLEASLEETVNEPIEFFKEFLLSDYRVVTKAILTDVLNSLPIPELAASYVSEPEGVKLSVGSVSESKASSDEVPCITKNFNTIKNNGTDGTAASNQCMLISILDHLRKTGGISKAINIIRFRGNEILKIKKSEWSENEDFDTNKGNRQINVLRRITRKYNINLRIQQVVNTNGNCTLGSEIPIQWTEVDSEGNTIMHTLDDIQRAHIVRIVQTQNPDHFELLV